jgi:hypothetical protein
MMSIYATLHTVPTKCIKPHKMIYITRGASAQLTYPLFDKVFKVEDIEQITFIFKQGRDVWSYPMFEGLELGTVSVNPRFHLLELEDDSAIIFNLYSEDTKQFKPGINIEYEIAIKLNTDSSAFVGKQDSIIIEPQHPIAIVDSLYSSL